MLFGITVIFVLFQRNRPEDVGLPPIAVYHGERPAVAEAVAVASNQESADTSWKATLEVIRNPMILRFGMVYFLLKPTRYAILFWGPVMAYERLGTSIGGSALVSMAFEVAGPISTIFAGYASDKWFQTRRMPVAVMAMLGLSLTLFLFPTLTGLGGPLVMASVFFLIGMLLHAPETLLSGVAAVDFGRTTGASSAVGFVNGSGSIGQILGLSLPGIISAIYGWDVLFTVFGFAALLGALILLPKWNALPGKASIEE